MYHYPMRAFPLLVAVVLFLCCKSPGNDTPLSTVQDFGFPGTDKTTIRNCAEGTIYIYKEYIIYTRQDPASGGYDIYIFRPAAEPSDPCSLDTDKAYFKIRTDEMEGRNFFSGIYGDYLFIDRGTGPSHRMMAVFDIEDKSFLLKEVQYSDASVSEGTLTYYSATDVSEEAASDIPCPGAEKWKVEGFGVIYERQNRLDLESKKLKSTDEYRCSPTQ